MFLLIFCTLFTLSCAQTSESPIGCYCSPDYKPVCTTDGTYDNSCWMDCARRRKNLLFLHDGACQKKEIVAPCFCKQDTLFPKPICEIRLDTGEHTTFKSRCIRECVRRNEKNKNLDIMIMEGMCYN